jgi:hypothetical protein
MDHLPTFSPGRSVTFTASAAVTGGRLVAITGDRRVAHTAGAGVVQGVAARDATADQEVAVQRGGQHELLASAAVAAGERIVSASDGRVAPLGAGDANLVIGHAVEAVAADATGRFQLYV